MITLDDQCWYCRAPLPTLALRAMGGYADPPRSSCETCYGCGSIGQYARNRFRAYRRQGDGWLIIEDQRGRLPPAAEGDPVELRAAKLAAIVLVERSTNRLSDAEWAGYRDSIRGRDPAGRFRSDARWAGWLARQIVEGDE